MKKTLIRISIFLFCFLADAQTISQSLKDQNIEIVTVDGNIIAGKIIFFPLSNNFEPIK